MAMTRRSLQHAIHSDDPVTDLRLQLESLETVILAPEVVSADLTLILSTADPADTVAQIGVQVWTADADSGGYGDLRGSDIGVEDDDDPSASLSLLRPAVADWIASLSGQAGMVASTDGQDDWSQGQVVVSWKLTRT